MLRSWELKIELGKSAGLAVYLQLVQKIIEDIQLGRLLPSDAMPGTRYLANSLGINRKTVIMAYDELIAQGWLVTEKRRGTFVNHNLPIILINTENSDAKVANDQSFATDELDADAPYEPELIAQDMINFNDGIPDTRLIPFNLLSRAFRHALVVSARANRLGYDSPRGILQLRKSIATMLNMERGLHIDVNNICTVRGSQMGIFLAARILIKPDDVVVVENLTYPHAREAFKSCGARILTIGQDDYGINIDELEKLCRKVRIRAVYVTPHHQFPTTVMMNADRRLRLLILAEQYGFAIIEDDYDHEFHFSHHPVFPLASTDRGWRVIYVGSMSKVLAPGLRVGYIVASPGFIDRCASEIMLIDRQGNSIAELAVSELMNSGEIKRHIRKTYKIYKERRDILEKLLRSQLSSFIDFDLPHGGLAFWLRVKDNIDIVNLVNHARTEKVNVLPGALFAENNANILGIRLGFGSLNDSELAEGVKRLKYAFERQSNRALAS